MKRGEVWWLNFGPGKGGEIHKQRPAVLISNDVSNKFFNRLQVIPLSTQISRIYPSEAQVTFNGQSNKAMTDQLMTVSKLRLTNIAGKLLSSEMKKVERVIKM
jgi:mRNA interferase MazF